MKTISTTIFLGLLVTFPAYANTLPIGQWRLESYNFQQKIAFPIDKNEIALNIHKDGKLGGRSGSNVNGGSYSIDDGKLKIGDLISTMMACEEPSMQFEQTYFTTLEGATEFAVDDGKLSITNAKTAHFVRFVREPHG